MIHIENIRIDVDTEIRDLEEQEKLKYFGIEEKDALQQNERKKEAKSMCAVSNLQNTTEKQKQNDCHQPTSYANGDV